MVVIREAERRMHTAERRIPGFAILLCLLTILPTPFVFAADTTPPTTPVVTDDGIYTSSATQLHASWTSSDPDSKISEYQYQIRQDSPSGSIIADWTSVGTATSVTRTGLSLLLGKTYFFGVKARNVAKLWSAVGYSDGILVDTTPPKSVSVTDDGATTTSTTQIHLTWTASSDPESGVVGYSYLMKYVKPDGWFCICGTGSLGTGTEATFPITLIPGYTYYFSVSAQNGAGLHSADSWSDGIKALSSDPSVIDADITSDTTWTLANSPYTVISTSSSDTYIWVRNGATLTIEPGVEVRFQKNTGLNIGSSQSSGVLKAQGTPSEPIVFTGATKTPGFWLGINLANAGPSVLENCVVEYAGRTGYIGANIRIDWGSPTIRNCTLRNAAQDGMLITPSNDSGPPPVVENNTFNANGSYPISIFLNNFNVSLVGNTYVNNGVQAIRIYGGSLVCDRSSTLPNDGLPYEFNGSILLAGGATLTIKPGVTLRFAQDSGLEVGYWSWGLGILKAEGTASAPITFTATTPTAGFWSGIRFDYTTPDSVLDYCTIEYGGAVTSWTNSANIEVSSSSPRVSQSTIRYSGGRGIYVYGSGSPVLVNNNIVSNTTSGLESTVAVVARLNWWGDTSGPSGIGPGTGNAISGPVSFEPWLAQVFTAPFQWVQALHSPSLFNQNGGWTTFTGTLPESGNWTITIKNATSQIVRTLTSSGMSIAQDWFGTDATNAALPNGTYTYQLSAVSVNTGQAAASAAGRTTLDSSVPIAKITSPTPDQMVPAGTSVNILGTAGGATFSSYKVEFGSGLAPSYWTLMTSKTTPVTNGLLATWDTSSLTDSLYTIRLTVTSTTGKTANESVTVRLLKLFNLSDAPDPFSPNGDGTQDTTTLSAQATFPVSWTLTIKDSTNTLIKSFTATGSMMSQVWDGKSSSGSVVLDGLYTYQFQGTSTETGVTSMSTTQQVTVDRTLPTATITSPPQNQTFITDDPLSFVGTADDVNFQNYTFAYGFGAAPASFTTLTTSTTKVVNGVLYTLDFQKVPLAPGTYTFRLTVTDKAGTSAQLDRVIILDHIQISNITVTPLMIDPYNAEQTSIAYTLSRPANVVLRIYQDVSKQLIRTFTLPNQSAGANAVSWNGKTDTNVIAPLEAYYFTIEATDGAGRKGAYNNATAPVQGPTPSYGVSVNAANFDPYRNDLVPISYTLSAIGRVTIQILNSPYPSSPVIRTLVNQEIRIQGPHTEYWDGRRDDGGLFQGAFGVTNSAGVSLPLNPIILSRAPVEFTNFRAEAYLIQPVFGEVSLLTYTLSKTATVSISLMDPNGNAVRTLLSNVSQLAGSQSLEWDGRTDSGKLVSVEGDYTVTLTAVDPVTGVSYKRVGNIVVYK